MSQLRAAPALTASALPVSPPGQPQPGRVALSRRFPILRPVIEEIKILERRWQTRGAEYRLLHGAADLKRTTVFSNHQSLLRRRLGASDPAMQDGKIRNLERAVPQFANLVLEPGQTLSFWKVLGRASQCNGFVSGMLIADGHAVEGVGGGLCQLANLLYWMALHSPLDVTEHHHHSLDLFPDSGRVLPFGSGASVYYNYIDLQLRNTTPHRLGLNVWLSGTHLHGSVWTDAAYPDSFRVEEQDHRFYRRDDGRVYRSNRLYQHRIDRRSGRRIEQRLITENDARVMYLPTGVEIRGEFS
jgi:vancomycin resistance protein VanW